MILRGQGVATLAAIWSNMARRMMTKLPR